MEIFHKSDYSNISIKAWAEEDRPREKLEQKGVHVLSDAELLALIIRTGTQKESAVELSRRVLAGVQNDLNLLGKLNVSELKKYPGMGQAKAIGIIAALELGRRRNGSVIKKKDQINGSQDVFLALHPILGDLPHEEFWILLLNRSNKIIGKENISAGGVSGTVVDAKIIFKKAVEQLASSIILCHNHPSGNNKPSEADVRLTKKLSEAGNLLEIPVLDHVILTEDSYYSFADEGMM